MITTIIRNATDAQLVVATLWTSNQLHIPDESITNDVAVAYVVKHFKAGQLEGWDGFIEHVEG
jgi:hypothetical protein